MVAVMIKVVMMTIIWIQSNEIFKLHLCTGTKKSELSPLILNDNNDMVIMLMMVTSLSQMITMTTRMADGSGLLPSPCFYNFLARTTFVLESLPEAKNPGQDAFLGGFCV